jgi:phage shock protein A
MPRSFFDKLNVLVRSQVNDLLSFGNDDDAGSADDRERSRRDVLARREIGENLSRDVAGLRKRVDDAIAYEKQLQGKVDTLYREIADRDAQADDALARNDEAGARRHIARIQQAQREVTMLEADLREHRHITGELISQVNTMEAMVEQGRRRQAEQERQTASDKQRTQANEQDSRIESLTRSLTERLDNTRQALSDLVNQQQNQGHMPEVDQIPEANQIPEAERDEQQTRNQSNSGQQSSLLREDDVIVEETPQPQRRPITSSREVDDDLSRRLARLSKPEDDDK